MRRRRDWLARLPAGLATLLSLGPAGADPSQKQTADGVDRVRRGRPFTWPRDHGMHPDASIEWWYLTGWLERSSNAAPVRPGEGRATAGATADPWLGFQLTFFRSRTGLAADLRSRFAPRHLVFAHAAWTDRVRPQHVHAHRMSRWSGQPGASRQVEIRGDEGRMWLDDWQLHREEDPTSPSPGAGGAWVARFSVSGRRFNLRLTATQALLLQGEAGYSRKATDHAYASHYVSEVQLATQGTVHEGGGSTRVRGRAWLDHEWSDQLLPPQAVGWDWIGFNLDDGSALTAFQLREAGGRPCWAGGSHRARDGAAPRGFAASEVVFRPTRHWRSPHTGGHYPVEWQVQCPTGPYAVRALMDGQELHDRRAQTPIYWEGLAELLDSAGRRIGLGYLEMTGYAGRLVL